MAVRTNRRPRTRDERDVEERPPTISPETRRGIVVVVLFAVAFLSILSLFELAGPVGEGISLAITLAFGWGRWIFPLVLLFLGYAMIQSRRFPLRTSTLLGLGLLLLSLFGLFHLFLPLEEAQGVIEQGNGGGYLGFAVAVPLQRIMGFWASLVVLIALFLIALLVFFNTSLNRLAERGGTLGSIISRLRHIRRPSGDQQFTRSDVRDHPMDDEVADADETPTEVDTEGVPQPQPTHGETKPLPIFAKKRQRHMTRLSFDLLSAERSQPSSGDINDRQERIRRTLENFGIDVEMGEVNVGPTVTQFQLKPAEGVKLSQITTLSNDIALALAAHPIRIEAPIPGKSYVGIEVPNESVALVGLRSVLESQSFRTAHSSLSIALGKDVSGSSIVADLDTMPHLLIAGATGSGKSVMINTLIVSLLYQNTPDQLKFIMVDPKRVELTVYNDIPHLLTPVITDSKKTVNALKWVVAEMDRRFQVLSEAGKRDIHTYHRDVDDGMPFLVLVVDELADLMSIAARDVEATITRLAQMARAVGIHIVLATQRPSVDVITGLIKANITTRIAFTVASNADSRTILDSSGAEKLLGRGDMLYISAETSKPKRIQGAFVSDDDIRHVVSSLKTQAQPEYEDGITEHQVTGDGTLGEDGGDEDETTLEEAKRVIVEAGKASASLLQRRMKVGYARAARILDILEERGLIGPGEGAKPREVFIAQEPNDLPPPPLDAPEDDQ